MKITWLRHFKYRSLKGPWAARNRQLPEQQQDIENFCKQHQIIDQWSGAEVPDESHDWVTLMFNGRKFYSLQYIDQCLIESVNKSKKFLHLSVNKYIVHTEQDQTIDLDIADLDQRLVKHWGELIDHPLVFCKYNSLDFGNFGNWHYPVTNLIWQISE
jgi:hypothetical protein